MSPAGSTGSSGVAPCGAEGHWFLEPELKQEGERPLVQPQLGDAHRGPQAFCTVSVRACLVGDLVWVTSNFIEEIS